MSDLTEEKWMAIGASARYGSDFVIARPGQKKEAIDLFLEKHMKDAMAADGQSPVA